MLGTKLDLSLGPSRHVHGTAEFDEKIVRKNDTILPIWR